MTLQKQTIHFLNTATDKFQYQLINRRKLPVVLATILFILAAITRFLPPVTPNSSMVFDESYFVPQVESYAVQRYYFDPHPPLAKFFLYLGMSALNPDAAQKIEPEKLGNLVNNYKSNLNLDGIRLAPKIFGSLVPLLVMGITLQLIWWRKESISERSFIAGSLIGFGAGLLAALDTTLIVESRYALLTQIMLFFMLLAVYLAFKYVNARSHVRTEIFFILTTIAVGCAMSVKWLALSIVPIVIIAYMYREYLDKLARKWSWRTFISVVVQRSLFLLIGGLLIYLSVFAWHFSQMKHYSPAADELSAAHIEELKTGTNKIGFLGKVMEWQSIAQGYSKGVPALDYTKKDEIGSMWVTWPIMARPINYYWQTDGNGEYGQIYLIGNPVVWMISLFGAFALMALGFARLFGKNNFKFTHFILILFFLGNWLPFALITRVMYLYHYIPALVIGMIMFMVFVHDFVIPAWSKLPISGKLGELLNNPNTKLILFSMFVLIVAGGYFFYAPLIYGQQQTRDEWKQRVLLKEWNMKWPSD